MKLTTIYTIAFCLALVFTAAAQTDSTAVAAVSKKSCAAKRGDKAFGKFDYNTAIELYMKALNRKNKKDDTLTLTQKIADSYRLMNETGNAELWYKKIADQNLDSKNLLYYADALRANQNYPLAKQYYQKYKAANPTDKSIDDILAGFDNLPELTKDKGVFRINTLGINSPQSDFGPAFYKNGELFFASNRNSRKHSNVQDVWSTNNFYQLYTASPDSGMGNVSRIKKMGGCSTNGKFHDGPASYNKWTNELIFTRSNYKRSNAKTAGDKNTVNLQLFSMQFPAKKRKLVSLPFNNADYSNAHPALSHDGKTLYFSSDKLGGQGGTDLYVTTQDQAGNWIEPQNLGAVINTRYDEKFPFIGFDGTLYFSSNALDGLGGLDIYRTKMEGGVWSRPENLGVPVNSSRDDFTFIMDSTNKYGYLASNREGGMGDDDIYHFTYDESKLDYKVIVRVIDAVTNQPVDLATLALESKNANPENSLTDAKGEKLFLIKGGKTCSVEAIKPGYKNGLGQLTPKNKNGVVVIQMRADIIKLALSIKEKETSLPVRDAAITITPTGGTPMNYATDENGVLTAEVPSGSYTISSPDLPSVQAKFSEADADLVTGAVKLDFMLPKKEIIVNVPLTAGCFSSAVSVTDLKTGVINQVAPNTNGEVRLDLRINNRYLINHNGRTDTISTIGVEPGGEIDGPCKFRVGQTWIIRNIYYDLNKWNIRPDAAQELDNLVRLMKENPTLEIELSSHTDCRSSARYNVVLSARRAKSAVDYIAKKGIKSRRIIAAGYGETQLVNGCVCEPTNESPCSDDQHQSNRRTEVKVLRY